MVRSIRLSLEYPVPWRQSLNQVDTQPGYQFVCPSVSKLVSRLVCQSPLDIKERDVSNEGRTVQRRAIPPTNHCMQNASLVSEQLLEAVATLRHLTLMDLRAKKTWRTTQTTMRRYKYAIQKKCSFFSIFYI
jgi:hypothetical protein